MSFASLKKYFQDLQLAIAIIEDLGLNRGIWQPYNNVCKGNALYLIVQINVK